MAINSLTLEGAVTQDVRTRINENFRDVSKATATFSATSGDTGTTLTNVTGLVTGELEPGTYSFRINLGTVATANSGLKIGLKQSVASMVSAIEYDAVGFTASGVVAARGTTTTDAATILGSTSAIIVAQVSGVVTVALKGTLQLQAAQNASHADTTSVFLNSFMEFQKIA